MSNVSFKNSQNFELICTHSDFVPNPVRRSWPVAAVRSPLKHDYEFIPSPNSTSTFIIHKLLLIKEEHCSKTCLISDTPYFMTLRESPFETQLQIYKRAYISALKNND